MSTLELKTYEIFKNKLVEKEAETVLEYFDSKKNKQPYSSRECKINCVS